MKKLTKHIQFLACVLVLFLTWSSYNAKNEVLSQELTAAQESLHIESQKAIDLNQELNEAKKELEVANTIVADLKDSEYELVYMGDFKLTHYCNETYKHICGGNGITATGTKTTVGTTIAVDPRVIPYGTQVYIEGYGWRTAQDCGGAVKQKQIDILVDTHSQALSMGTTHGGVWILVKKS